MQSKDLVQLLEVETSHAGNLATWAIIRELTLRCCGSRFGSTRVEETNERGACYGAVQYQARSVRRRPGVHTAAVATEEGSSRDRLGVTGGA
ncbi:MAG TPA: hypothetical protein VGC57_12430, partial [Cellulomonas sp.]